MRPHHESPGLATGQQANDSGSCQLSMMAATRCRAERFDSRVSMIPISSPRYRRRSKIMAKCRQTLGTTAAISSRYRAQAFGTYRHGVPAAIIISAIANRIMPSPR